MAAAKTTKLDSDVSKPSTTAPGDGPADTTNPDERAQSVTPNPGEEAQKAGTVNAVKPAPKAATRSTGRKHRIETFKAYAADGTEVTVTRDIETGKSEVKGD